VQARFAYECAWDDLHRRNLLLRLVAHSLLPGVTVLILLMNWAYGDVPWHLEDGSVAADNRLCGSGTLSKLLSLPALSRVVFGLGFSHESNACAHRGLADSV